jgi:hypothetical protein
MAATVWKLMQALSGRASSLYCRRCGDGIPATDPFGMSEGVCRSCRLDPDR